MKLSVAEYFNLYPLWAYSADDNLVIFFLFFPENSIWHFMQIVSIGDNLHECQTLFSGKNTKKKIQSTLVILNSKGLSETLRDIRTSKYQSCRNEENNKSNNHI